LFQYPNVSDLLKTIGVKVEEVKSSPLKAAPNGFEPRARRRARRSPRW
jgi:protease-4